MGQTVTMPPAQTYSKNANFLFPRTVTFVWRNIKTETVILSIDVLNTLQVQIYSPFQWATIISINCSVTRESSQVTFVNADQRM